MAEITVKELIENLQKYNPDAKIEFEILQPFDLPLCRSIPLESDALMYQEDDGNKVVIQISDLKV